MSSAQAISAIAAGLALVSITALIITTVALCLTRRHRDRTQERRGSVTTPVIDICRLARSSVERQSCVAELYRPPEAYLSSKATSSPNPFPLTESAKAWQSSSIRVVSKHEDALRWTGLHRLDLEAQPWKPTMESSNGNAESSSPLFIDLPISPPPSYSQIDRSVLVSVP